SRHPIALEQDWIPDFLVFDSNGPADQVMNSGRSLQRCSKTNGAGFARCFQGSALVSRQVAAAMQRAEGLAPALLFLAHSLQLFRRAVATIGMAAFDQLLDIRVVDRLAL